MHCGVGQIQSKANHCHEHKGPDRPGPKSCCGAKAKGQAAQAQSQRGEKGETVVPDQHGRSKHQHHPGSDPKLRGGEDRGHRFVPSQAQPDLGGEIGSHATQDGEQQVAQGDADQSWGMLAEQVAAGRAVERGPLSPSHHIQVIGRLNLGKHPDSRA
jgi:hypothetical protein